MNTWIYGGCRRGTNYNINLLMCYNHILANDRAYYFYFLILFFFNFWLCWVFIAAHGLSLVVVSRGYSWLWCLGFSLRWLLLLWCAGLVAPRHVGSSQTRARTCVPCIGRWILNHCATREVQQGILFLNLK